MNDLVHIQDLKKDFHIGEISVHALRGINLKVNEGDFVAIMGSSGSGKSTLLNILGCLEKSSSGLYKLDNVDISELHKDELANIRNEKIGFVFQSYNLLPRTTALENVELPLFYNKKIKSKERKKKAISALEKVGLADRVNHMPNQMSGGQQQRVAIARALVNEPKIILADEATGNLDTRTSYEIIALMQELNSLGKTIIFVTHEMDISMFMKRRVTFKDGRILKDEIVINPKSAIDELNKLPEEE